VREHNIYRCMHDSAPVVWSEPVHQDAKTSFASMKHMKHSESFTLAPPAGPAGENLYQSSFKPSAGDAAASWYTEYDDCGTFPGCKAGATGVTGHFTTMVWNGAQEIGCTTNKHNLVACRYKGSDSPTCRTPNMGGAHPTNVFARVRALDECVALVDQCGIGVGGCGAFAPGNVGSALESEANKSFDQGYTDGYMESTNGRLPPNRTGGGGTGDCGTVYTGSSCGEEKAGWSCPPDNGCPGGDCTGDWQAFVREHNIYRCMHDSAPVVWSEPVYQDVLTTFQSQTAMVKSDSFSLAAPAGPAGENLYLSTRKPTVKESVAAWYGEHEDCGRLPGCKGGATGVTGHFTAMMWNGAQEIGCAANKHNLVACRYKGSDTPTCRTPNMGGEYKSNVFPRVRTRAECERRVDACNCGRAAPAPSPVAPSPAPPAPVEKCGKSEAGWTCPKGGGCPGGKCTGDWKAFVQAHNVYRCMHDAKPLHWSEPVYQDALKTFKTAKKMVHSDSFSVAAPAGPAGENLYQSAWKASADDAVAAWYAENENCGAFPGCKAGSTGITGHFTVMVWNGAQEVGCATSDHNVVACRYKGSDFPSCRTPNMHGQHAANVFKAVRSLEKCRKMVKECDTDGSSIKKTRRRSTKSRRRSKKGSRRRRRRRRRGKAKSSTKARRRSKKSRRRRRRRRSKTELLEEVRPAWE